MKEKGISVAKATLQPEFLSLKKHTLLDHIGGEREGIQPS